MTVTVLSRGEVAERLTGYLRRFELTATERYEADAESFYRETGLMAPGKDAPMAGNFGSDSERRVAYEAWVSARNNSLRDAIAAAVLFLREAPQSADAVVTGSTP